MQVGQLFLPRLPLEEVDPITGGASSSSVFSCVLRLFLLLLSCFCLLASSPLTEKSLSQGLAPTL